MKYLKKIIIISFLAVMLIGCGKNNQNKTPTIESVKKRIESIKEGNTDYKVADQGNWMGIDWFITTDGVAVVKGNAKDAVFLNLEDHNQDTRFAPWNNNDKVYGVYYELSQVNQSLALLAMDNNVLYADVSKVDVSELTEFSRMIYNCPNLVEIRGLEEWDTSQAVIINEIFEFLDSLEELNGIEHWDVSNVNKIQGIIAECKSLKTVDLSAWDVSNVTTVVGICCGCSSLSEVDITGWDVSHFEEFTFVFDNCSSLTKIQGIEDLKFSDGVNLMAVFKMCSSLESLDLSSWNVEASNICGLFEYCTSLKYVDIRNIQCTNTSRWHIFSGDELLEEVYVNSSTRVKFEDEKYSGYVPDCIVYVE